MGCDIHSYAETQNEDGTWSVVGEVFPTDEFHRKHYGTEFRSEPFDNRNYGLFGFLAGVRNYSAIQPLDECRGFPVTASDEVTKEYESYESDAHSASWFLLSELLAVNYDEFVNDRRVTREISPGYFDGGVTGDEDEGLSMPLREFLSSSEYFQALDVLATLGNPEKVRVVLWFDN